MQLFPIRNDFSPEFYKAFALLVIGFGRLEYLIKLCIKDLVGLGARTGLAEAEQKRQFAALCDYAAQLGDEKLSESESAVFHVLIDQARSLASERHDAIHACWTTDSNSNPLRIRPRYQKKTRAMDWSYSRVVGVREIMATQAKVENLCLELHDHKKKWSIDAAKS
jgi:hypothetical protein